MKADPRHVERSMTSAEIREHFARIYGSKADAQHKQFEKFMYGQTGMVDEQGRLLCYSHDINRFIDGMPVVD